MRRVCRAVKAAWWGRGSSENQTNPETADGGSELAVQNYWVDCLLKKKRKKKRTHTLLRVLTGPEGHNTTSSTSMMHNPKLLNMQRTKKIPTIFKVKDSTMPPPQSTT